MELNESGQITSRRFWVHGFHLQISSFLTYNKKFNLKKNKMYYYYFIYICTYIDI